MPYNIQLLIYDAEGRWAYSKEERKKVHQQALKVLMKKMRQKSDCRKYRITSIIPYMIRSSNLDYMMMNIMDKNIYSLWNHYI